MAFGEGPRIKSESEQWDHRGLLFGHVYANELARMTLLAGSHSTFPVGATIVREKLLNETSITPDVLTVMIKHDRGFNPEANDWEFLMVDGSVGKVEMRQKEGECLGCHRWQKDKDFTFRRFE